MAWASLRWAQGSGHEPSPGGTPVPPSDSPPHASSTPDSNGVQQRSTGSGFNFTDYPVLPAGQSYGFEAYYKLINDGRELEFWVSTVQNAQLGVPTPLTLTRAEPYASSVVPRTNVVGSKWYEIRVVNGTSTSQSVEIGPYNGSDGLVIDANKSSPWDYGPITLGPQTVPSNTASNPALFTTQIVNSSIRYWIKIYYVLTYIRSQGKYEPTDTWDWYQP